MTSNEDTERVILDLLTARNRLGLTSWQCPASFLDTLRALSAKGTVYFEATSGADTYTVSFTDEGHKYLKTLEPTPLEAVVKFWRMTAWKRARADERAKIES